MITLPVSNFDKTLTLTKSFTLKLTYYKHKFFFCLRTSEYNLKTFIKVNHP
jgi:hypothetical protein